MTPEALKAWRKERGWSQSRAASEVGISSRMWGSYERGEYPVPLVVENAVKWVSVRAI